MEIIPTWFLFSRSDIGFALIGLAGLISAIVVLRTAFGNVANREITLRKNAQRAQSGITN